MMKQNLKMVIEWLGWGAMGFQLRVSQGLIGWLVVEQFAGMMYLLNIHHHITEIDCG